MDLIQAAPIILCRIFQCFGSAMVMIMVDAMVGMVGWVRRGINCNQNIINFYLSGNPPF